MYSKLHNQPSIKLSGLRRKIYQLIHIQLSLEAWERVWAGYGRVSNSLHTTPKQHSPQWFYWETMCKTVPDQQYISTYYQSQRESSWRVAALSKMVWKQRLIKYIECPIQAYSCHHELKVFYYVLKDEHPREMTQLMDCKGGLTKPEGTTYKPWHRMDTDMDLVITYTQLLQIQNKLREISVGHGRCWWKEEGQAWNNHTVRKGQC